MVEPDGRPASEPHAHTAAGPSLDPVAGPHGVSEREPEGSGRAVRIARVARVTRVVPACRVAFEPFDRRDDPGHRRRALTCESDAKDHDERGGDREQGGSGHHSSADPTRVRDGAALVEEGAPHARFAGGRRIGPNSSEAEQSGGHLLVCLFVDHQSSGPAA